MKEIWLYNDNENSNWAFSEEYRSKEEAIEAAKKDKELETNTIFVGKKVAPRVAGINIDSILEEIVINSTFGLEDGVADDFLNDISREHYEELEEKLNDIFFDWLKKYDYEPKWFEVENIEKIENIEEIELMDIYSEEGTKVRYLNQNGYDYEREEANKELVEGEVYTVKYTIVGSWYSTVVLKEFPDKEFNTVMFGAVE